MGHNRRGRGGDECQSGQSLMGLQTNRFNSVLTSRRTDELRLPILKGEL